jgi:GNAT superfamily N-acetyltransferase
MKVELVDLEPHHWACVFELQKEAYASDLQEQPEVLRAKGGFVGSLCKVVKETDTKNILGYLLAHPWKPKDAPQLNTVLNDIDQEQSQDYTGYQNLFIHDFALGKNLQGRGFAIPLIQDFLQQARHNQIKAVSLVAVQGSVPFWQKFGFNLTDVAKDLSDYGDDARFMYLEYKDLPE